MAISSNVENLFLVLDNTAQILQEELSNTYLEALIETGDNLFQEKVIQDIDEVNKKRLIKEYDKIQLNSFDREVIRKAFQLCILKGMKEATQSHHMMTPDSVALFVGYLINKITESKESYTLFDPAIGTANLVSAILNQSQKQVEAFGVEVDDVLLRLAFVSANIQEQQIQLFKQDALMPLYLAPVDIVVSDLPVGYYPNDVVANEYDLKADEGHSYSHHLFIEQSLNYTKDGGYLILLIPNFLFESEEAPKLNKFIKDHAYIQGLLQLPLSMFKNEKFAKSIFIMQKKGEGVKPPNQALLVDLPSFSKQEAMQGIIQKIDQWFKTKMTIS